VLTVAICSHHFTAMGAVSIIPEFDHRSVEIGTATSWLAVAVRSRASPSSCSPFAGLALDIRDRRRIELEADRMRGLAMPRSRD